MEDEDKIKKLREKLHRYILRHGRDSPKTLKVSKKLDRIIVKELKKQCGNKDK